MRTKMIETLSDTDIENMFIGQSVGIFKNLFLPQDKFFDKAPDMCLNYYTQRSGKKSISSAYDFLIKHEAKTPSKPEDLMARMIRGKFIDKWNRCYDSLLSQYDVLDTFSSEETVKGKNTETTTYNSQNKQTATNKEEKTYDTTDMMVGNNSDSVTYGKTETEIAKTETDITTSKTQNGHNDVYGFNSAMAVPSEEDGLEITDNTKGVADKNKTDTAKTSGGTDTNSETINETNTKTGKDTTSHNINNTNAKSGNDNVAETNEETKTNHGRDKSGAEMIDIEIEMRIKNVFFDIIFSDIDSVATLSIYD